MRLRVLHQAATRAVAVASLVIVAVACVSSSDGGAAHATHACFVHCADDSLYCGEGLATKKACNDRAAEVCEGSSVLDAVKADDCTCDNAACAPNWYPKEATACAGALECNVAFKAFLDSVPACGVCLKSACAAEVDGCGPQGEGCAASIACFAEPLFADLNSQNGTCAQASPYDIWPRSCYFFRDACGAIRETEPAGKAFAQCLVDSCVNDCFLGGQYLDACSGGPPPCSTLSAGG